MAFSLKLFSAILEDMTNWMIANQSKVTDFNEGAVTRSFLEAVGYEIEQSYIRTRVGFDESLPDIPFYAFNFIRKSGQKSSGNVVFSRTGTTGDITIPIGTLVATADGTQFETTAVGTIQNGNQDSNSVSISATEEGTESNVPANTITVVVTPVNGVESVDNSASTTGGLDEETDESFVKRFREFIEGLGQSSENGLITGAKLVTGIRSASTIEHFPPSSSYNVSVYVDDGAGNAPAALIAAALLKLEGEGTASNPGYKAAGINIQVLAPSKVTQDVTVVITDDGTLAEITMTYNIEQAISNYINNLVLGDDIIKNSLVKVIMAVSGVSDISLTTPASNVTINPNQIARTGTMTVTFS
ncbi:hypothetical protein LCGC14_1390340 [marine sediment metagenome]|uniref:Uncharacterized protein n=1 Tax=marine sediment metagenome TaxID=412755 RepID=A0A0F9N1Q9_9ZZZZ